MTIKDDIDRIVHERGETTTSELVDSLYEGSSHCNRSSKISTVYSKCRILEKWGRIERAGENDDGQMVWRPLP